MFGRVLTNNLWYLVMDSWSNVLPVENLQIRRSYKFMQYKNAGSTGFEA